MKKRIVKTAYSVLLAVLLLVSVFQTAFAIDNSVDLDASGYVTVTLTGGEDKHEPVSGATFTIYRVAGIGRVNGELAYVYTGEFEGNGALLRNLDDVTLSEHLAAYAKNKGLNGTTKTSDENGKIAFGQLPVGLYLIVQNGKVDGFYSVSPFIITIPMSSSGSTEPVYDVDASPKVEIMSLDVSFTAITVDKVWTNSPVLPEHAMVQLLRDGEIYETVELNAENGWTHTWEFLEDTYHWSVVETDVPDGYNVDYHINGANVTIENTKSQPSPILPDILTVKKVWDDQDSTSRPDKVEIELWAGDNLYDTVVLNSENDWTHTWDDLPARSDWSVKEINIPTGYTVSYSSEGSVITITNKLKPASTDNPDNSDKSSPSLIYTGQLNWPIPILACAGLALICIGWVLVTRKRKIEEQP